MDTLDLHPALLASDTIDEQTGFFSRLSDAVTKGIPAAAISGGLSIYNTALDYAGKEQVDVSQAIRDFDEGTGDFYSRNKEGIDLAGFVGTSLIPGGLGIKALKLARSGQTVGAMGRALGFASSRVEANLSKALKQLGATGGTIDATIQGAKYSTLAFAFADNVLLSTAAETAIAATMNDSPIFEGQDKWDFAKNIAMGAFFGGAVGGVVESWTARGILKKAQTTIESSKRNFDVIFDPVQLGLKKADEIDMFTKNILSLPEDFFNTTFKYNWSGKQNTVVLETSDAFKSTKTSAERLAFDKLALKFNELAGGGEHTGQAFFDFIKTRVSELKAQGKDGDAIYDSVSGYLSSLKRVHNLKSTDGSLEGPAQFFVNNEPKGLGDLFTTQRGKTSGKQAYYLTGDVKEVKFTSVGQSGWTDAQEAFEAGYDAVFTSAGKVAINPKSQIIKKTPDAALSNKFYLDLQSGSLTHQVDPVGADLLHKSGDFIWEPKGVLIGKTKFNQADDFQASLDSPVLDSSARFMWASRLAVGDFKKRVIDASDFALLDRAVKFPEVTLSDKTMIKLADGTTVAMSNIVDPKSYVNQLKLDWLGQTLNKQVKGYDVRNISNHMNVSREWVEEAIGNNFQASPKLLQEARDLTEYFKPQSVMLEWDNKLPQMVSKPGPNFQATAELGSHYRLKIQNQINSNAADSVFGPEDAAKFIAPDVRLSLQTNTQGAGASFAGAANADYGAAAELHVQETGKNLHNLIGKWKENVIGRLAPHINAVRDDLDASAELGIVTTTLRQDPQKYYLVTDDLTGQYRLVDRRAVKAFQSPNSPYADLDEAIEEIQFTGARGAYEIKSSKVGDFLAAHQVENAENISKQTVLANAMGVARDFDSQVIYAPPVDTKRYPFFAFVRSKPRLGTTSELTMITAKSDEQLRKLANSVPDDYEVLFKNDTKNFFKAKGEYEYSQQLNESTVNSVLQRRGVLSDFFPETRGENVLEDWVRFHGNQQSNIARTAVQVKNRQFVSELQFLSEQWQQSTTSTVTGFAGLLKKNVADPFQDYLKTMLDYSKQGEFPLMDSLNEFVDQIGRKAYLEFDKIKDSVFGRKNDLASIQKANELMSHYGLPVSYGTDFTAYLEANQKFGKNLIKDTLTKVNSFLATSVLRLDFFNSVINTISTPIMLGTEMASIKGLMAKDPQLIGKLADLTSLQVPGQQFRFPSTTKLIGQAVQNFFGKDKDALIKRYMENGDIVSLPTQFHEVLDDLAFMPKKTLPKWKEQLEAAVEKGGKITFNDQAEQLTRFIAADVMRQMSQPLVDVGKMTLREQNAYISTFVNRVQGNYVPSQRPIVFQGTVGGAVGLFQTYAFNVFQQLFRHVENGNTRAALTFGALQTSIYGFNGLPFFDAINQHIIGSASGNTGHTDAYTALPRMNKELGDWLLYGSASAFPLFGEKSPALYSRGDINPRNASVIPINPADIPAVSASVKLATSVYNFGKQVASGADISTAMLQALEHHGWNRPLAGFAQVLAGQSTTGKGALISSASDMETTSSLVRLQDRMVQFGGVWRMLGAKPMDEAIALNELYRNKQYEALDRQRIEALGTVVKTKLGKNEVPDDEDMTGFMESYMKAGGRIENFSSSMQRWTKDANVSVINQMARKMTTTSAKRMQIIMGGDELQDYQSIAETPVGD